MKTALSKMLPIFVLLFICANSSAKTIIIPDNEKNIQSAIEKTDEGDTVFIREGTYNETIVMKEGITLIGESASKSIIRGKGRGVVIVAANNSLIKNLTVCNGSTGIRCDNTNPTIEACIIRDNKGTGIHTLISIPNIRNSIIVRNDWTGIYCESGRSIKTVIEHNVISENGYSGIMLSGSCEVLIQNNIIHANKQFGIWASEASRKSRIIYNDFFANRNASNYYVTIDKSNINEDPGFAQITGGYDFFTPPTTLLGKGKDGKTIGLITEKELEENLNDPDGDGIFGEKDLCPSMAEDFDGFEDEDGCPDFDNDKDGIYDTHDQCKDDPEDFDNFQDEDGCSDPDNDGDGVPDSSDICGSNKETINGYKDDDGCPDEIPDSVPLTK